MAELNDKRNSVFNLKIGVSRMSTPQSSQLEESANAGGTYLLNSQADQSSRGAPLRQGNIAAVAAAARLNNLRTSGNYEKLTVAVKEIKVKRKERKQGDNKHQKHLKLKNIVTSPPPNLKQVHDGMSQQDLKTGFQVLSPGVKVTVAENRTSTMSLRSQFSQCDKSSHMFLQQPFRSGQGSQFPQTRYSGTRQGQIQPLDPELIDRMRRLSSSQQQLAQSTTDNEYDKFNQANNIGVNESSCDQDTQLRKSRQHSTQSRFCPAATSGEHAFRGGNSGRGSDSLDKTAFDFVARNSGIQRLLQQNMEEGSSVNYDIFKRSDNVDTIYKQSVMSPMSPQETRTSFFAKTQKTFQQTTPKLPQLKVELQHHAVDDLNALKGSKRTMRSTMRHLMQTHNQQQLEEEKRRGSNLSARNSHIEYHRAPNASQTFSQGFGKINAADASAAKKRSLFQSNPAMTLDVSSPMIPAVIKQDSRNNINRIISIPISIPINPLSPRQSTIDFSRTESNFQKSAMKNSDFMVQDVDKSDCGKTMGAIMNPMQRSFEQLDSVEQAKLMRIGLDESRRNRFMALYEANQQTLQNKIRKWGHSPISKSVQIKKSFKQSKRNTLHTNMSFMVIEEEEEALYGSTTDIRKVTIKQLSKRGLHQSVDSVKASLKKLNLNHDSPRHGSPRNKDVIIDREEDETIDVMESQLYQRLNEPIRLSGRIDNFSPEKPLVAPYVPQKKIFVEQSITNYSEIMKQDSQNESITQTSGFAIPQSSMNVLSIERMKRKPGKAESSRIIAVKIYDDMAQSEQPKMDRTLTRDCDEDYIDDNELSSDDSSSKDSLPQKGGRLRKVNFVEDDISVRQSELERIDTKAGSVIKVAIRKGKRAVERKHEIAKNIIMEGQSHYKFPDRATLEKHNEVWAQQALDTSLRIRFKGNDAQLGFAMVDQEKRDDDIVRAERNLGLDQHVRFLTGDEDKLLGDEFAIFHRDPLIKKPGAGFTFQELSDVEMQLMAENANQFDKKILYQQINKVANCSNVQENRAEHPEYVYYMECAQDTDLPLPVLSHIYANTLNLANYTLSQGHCQALNSAAKYLQRNINRVRFDNCGIDGGEMASLISAFVQFRDFKSIIYRKNEFTEQSLECLKHLLAKRIPYHLQELRISNCRLSPIVTRNLITAIKTKSQLKQFELAETSLTQEDVEAIGEYAKNSRQLEELELSSCSMLPSMLYNLMEYTSQNKRLVQLNISYNNMIEGFSGNNMVKVLETQVRVQEQLFNFIRTSKKLIHLDLTATNLSENVMMHILPAIKKATSLQGIHLSGNPGVTEAFKNEARKLLKTHPCETPKQLNLVKLLLPETLKRFYKLWLREAIKIKHISIGKSLVQNGATEDKFINYGSKMILMRYLSHKDDIPGSAQWQILTRKQDHCWLCEREMKGYIFWTPQMKRRSHKILRISDGEREAIFNELEQPEAITTQIPQRPDAYQRPLSEQLPAFFRPKKESQAVTDTIQIDQPTERKEPVICGSFTDWKPRKMIRLFDFLQDKEPKKNKLDYRSVFEFLQKAQKFEDEVERFEKCESHHLTQIEDMMQKREKEIFYDWRMMLEKVMTYKKPFFVNSDVVRDDEDYRNIYIAPVFSRSGRQIFCIQPGDTSQSLEIYSSIIDFRQEDVPAKVSKSYKRRTVKKFKKPVSVFASWKTDTENVREKCLYDHDFLHWKLEKFIKDSEQRNLIEDLFYDYFFFLKGCFLEVAAETAWPCLTSLGFASFCQRAGLVDNVHLNLSDIDRTFIAARLEEGTAKKQNSIVRFMFFEAVARISIKRFYDGGKGECTGPAEAVAKAIEVMKESWKFDNWEQFRWQYLYQMDVQEALNANLNELRQLSKVFLKPRKTCLELDDCVAMMTQSSVVGAAQAHYCFGMSKMTTIFEREKKNSEGQIQLEFVEFLEFIGRCAYSKFQGSELEEQLDLAEKIEYILDDLFAMVHLTRKEREGDEEFSETDDSTDYY